MYKKYFENKKAVSFDLDGTIVDTKDMWIYAVEEVLIGLKVENVYVKDIFKPGASLHTVWDTILGVAEIDVKIPLEQLVTNTHTKMIEQINTLEELEPKDGFWDLMFELKNNRNYKVALATNTHKAVAMKILDKCDITELFDVIITGNDVENKKPHPEMYRKVIKQLGLTKEEILVFEDSIAGTTAAIKAGLDTLVIWDQETPHSQFSTKLEVFAPDFTEFIGNMDKTYKEILQETAENSK